MRNLEPRAGPLIEPGAACATPADLARVAVVGTSGSGKTLLARLLARRLDCPCHELDAMYWRPNWQPAPAEDFRRSVQAAVAGERWVIDGNYSVVRDLIWPRATAVVWLNHSFPVVFARSVARALRRIVRREELFSGNRESIRMTFFSRGSILLWVLQTYSRNRRRYRELRAGGDFPHLHWYELRSPRQAEAFVQSLRER